MSRRVWSVCLYAMFLLVLSEGFLWLVASFSPSANLLLSNQYGAPRNVNDPLLGHRPNPDFAEHDEWGFRNALVGPLGLRSRKVPERIDVVALGDSQTYGINAPANKSWPAQLSEQTCHTVYNMAVGATGPPHYLLNLDQALALSPELVIVGFYFGNDFWNSVFFVHHQERVPETLTAWREAFQAKRPAFKALFEQIYPAAVRKSLEAARILEPGFSRDPNLAERPDDSFDKRHSVGAFLRENLKLYGFVRLVKSMATNSIVREGRHEARERADPRFWGELCAYAAKTPGVVCYETKNMQTVLDTRLRIRDARIIDAGIEIAVDVLVQIRDRLRKAKTSYLVVFIPSKEYVYAQALPGRFDDVDPAFKTLSNQEGQAREKVKTILRDLGIPIHDALPDMVREIQAGRAIYPASSQSHPNSHGYEVIAQSIAQYLGDGC